MLFLFVKGFGLSPYMHLTRQMRCLHFCQSVNSPLRISPYPQYSFFLFRTSATQNVYLLTRYGGNSFFICFFFTLNVLGLRIKIRFLKRIALPQSHSALRLCKEIKDLKSDFLRLFNLYYAACLNSDLHAILNVIKELLAKRIYNRH